MFVFLVNNSKVIQKIENSLTNTRLFDKIYNQSKEGDTMDLDLKIIKKKYGEKMMHLCRELFPTLLETEGKLSELMLKLFNPSRYLYEDIVNNHLKTQFKDYIYSNLEPSDEALLLTHKTPEELLSEVGYDFYECTSDKELQAFKKYYQEDEELCSFKDNRTKTHYVFFAVKKNVEEIKRENYKNPYRENEYGVSVISIQFSKGENNTLSIKNRYNHTVKHPDATFSNNLENIIPGLTRSFEINYNLNLANNKNHFHIPGYIKTEDNKLYKYNYEFYNTYYCDDNIIIKDGKIIETYKDKEKYIILDYFILDLVNKKIFLQNDRIEDSFLDGLKDIEKITIINSKENDNKFIIIKCKNNNAIIEINQHNQIVGYENDNLEEIGNQFLSNNTELKYINTPKVKKIGDWCLMRNTSLESIYLPELVSVGNYFLAYNYNLTEAYLPKLKKAGNSFLSGNNALVELSLPSLEYLGDRALTSNTTMLLINLPRVKVIGEEFLNYNNTIKGICFPNLEILGNYALTNNYVIEIVNLPKLRKTGLYFLNKKNDNLIEVYFPYYNKRYEYIKLAESNRYEINQEETIKSIQTKKEKRLYKRFIQRLHE